MVENIDLDWSNISVKEKNKEFRRLYKKIGKEIGVTKESYFRDRLADRSNGKTEVRVESGFIDVATDKEIIEVKRKRKWKEAVGQIQVYGLFIRNKERRVHLIDDLSNVNEWIIEYCCRELDIKVTYEKDPVLEEISNKVGNLIYFNQREQSIFNLPE